MKPKVIFDLAVRLLGLFFLYEGLSAIPGIFGTILSRALPGSVINVILSLWPFAVAWWLIGGAPQLSHRAYPESDDSED